MLIAYLNIEKSNETEMDRKISGDEKRHMKLKVNNIFVNGFSIPGW